MMKFLKKFLTAAFAFTMSLVFLAACAQTAATTSELSESSAAPAETTVSAVETTEAATSTAAETSAAETAAEQTAAVKIVDMTGREIELSAPAQRIVALTPSDCEILFAIGAGETLVGRGEYCNYPAEVLEVPAVQSGQNTNIEQIIALQPDVLLMSTMAQTEEQVKQLEQAGIKVVVSDAFDFDGVYSSIRMIGNLMGKTDNAESVIAEMQATIADLSAKADGDSSKSIYFEVSPLEYGLWTAGAGTFMNEAADILKLKNAFDDVDGWGEISEEQVLERNPDYILTISMYFGEGPTPIEEIKSRAAWENVTAVKDDAILNFQNDELSRPGPRLAEGVQKLYDFVYGEKTE